MRGTSDSLKLGPTMQTWLSAASILDAQTRCGPLSDSDSESVPRRTIFHACADLLQQPGQRICTLYASFTQRTPGTARISAPTRSNTARYDKKQHSSEGTAWGHRPAAGRARGGAPRRTCCPAGSARRGRPRGCAAARASAGASAPAWPARTPCRTWSGSPARRNPTILKLSDPERG